MAPTRTSPSCGGSLRTPGTVLVACSRVLYLWQWPANTQDSRGSTWCLLAGPAAAAAACALLEQQVQRLEPTHGSLSSGGPCPPLELVYVLSCCLRLHAGKEAPMAVPPLSSCAPQQWCLASLAGPGFFLVHTQLPHSSLIMLSPRSQP